MRPSTTICNIRLDTERRRDRDVTRRRREMPRPTYRAHIRRDFDRFCVLRPHWQCFKSERDECEDSRF